MIEWLVPALVGLLPVLGFLAALVALESFKLVRLRTVVAVVAAGALVAVACYGANAALMDALALDLPAYSRYAAPLVEELLKAAVVGVLVHTHRVGFLVDGAILGFAVGAGFAVVENLYYAQLVPDAGLGTWIVRGFGTAIMHGGATAIYTMATLALLEVVRPRVLAFVPGFAAAVVLHSAFNHMFLSPKLSTLAVVVVIPPLILLVFHRSQAAVGDWLGRGFDSDAERLALIRSGQLTDAPLGRYLASLRSRFDGPVVADLLCYLRLYTELAMRAKGVMMMRENGFDVPVDDQTKATFDEMRYLEKSIGRTGLLALRPVLPMSQKELWQLQMLGK
ncbi:MAG TPA: PrsW family glutamic-type intramembrane protease [Casimicrobiaceae bacterium]|nr:PrsW family glutamic-type intramembrane protease [Casimicrobiaceae bacterium]